MARKFYNIDAYSGHGASYSLLPFKFMRLNAEQELLVNEVGEFVVVDSGTAREVVDRKLSKETELYKTLKSKQFVYDADSSELADLLAVKYRTKKSFLENGTQLHIFVVTLRCEHSCQYCQVSRQNSTESVYDMTPETANRSLALMMESPGKNLTLEFQGGEPLLAWDLIKHIVPNARRQATAHGKSLEIVIVSNLSQLSDEMIRYIAENDIHISTSLDGPAFIHNQNRPRPGNNSHQLLTENLAKLRATIGSENVSAMMTTTRLSLDCPREIIDEYVRLGFSSVFLRPLSPYGFAVKSRRKTGYEMERFLQFYKVGLDYLIELNRRGVAISEFYTTMLLTKILTPYATSYVDLQSPAGAVTSALVYNYDGALYATDESRMLAEMNDTSFRIGSVHDMNRADLIRSEVYSQILAAGINESLPGCADCALQSYCGADPVYHHKTQGDLYGHRPSSGFCYRNTEVLKHLFELLTNGDEHTRRTLRGWVSRRTSEPLLEACN